MLLPGQTPNRQVKLLEWGNSNCLMFELCVLKTVFRLDVPLFVVLRVDKEQPCSHVRRF